MAVNGPPAPFEEAKRKNLLAQKEDRREGREVFTANPEIVVVEPTNRCNLSCRHCARNYWDKTLNPETDMSMDTLERLVPFFKTARAVYAFGHGEPTLGKNFLAILRRAKEFGCEVQFTTNGTRRDDAFTDAVIEAGVDLVNLSLDALEPGASRERRGIDPVKPLQWLQRIRVRKVARRRKNPETGVSFVADRENLGELPNLIDALHDVGSSVLVISHFVAWKPALHDRSAYLDEPAFREAFARAKERGESKGITVILRRPG